MYHSEQLGLPEGNWLFCQQQDWEVYLQFKHRCFDAQAVFEGQSTLTGTTAGSLVLTAIANSLVMLARLVKEMRAKQGDFLLLIPNLRPNPTENREMEVLSRWPGLLGHSATRGDAGYGIDYYVT